MSDDKVKIKITTKFYTFTTYVDKQHIDQIKNLDTIAVGNEEDRRYLKILNLEVVQ